MPGGQSASALGASLEVLERSTGTSTSIFGVGFGLAGPVGGEAGETAGFNVGAFICVFEAWTFVLRMLSIEKLRFLACCAAAAGRVTSEAASSRSVGVRGGDGVLAMGVWVLDRASGGSDMWVMLYDV